MDVWIDGTKVANERTLTGHSCGGVPYDAPIPDYRGTETRVGSIHYPYVERSRHPYANEGFGWTLSAISFAVPRTQPWAYLRKRAEDTARFDRNESPEPESTGLALFVWSVTNPEVPKMQDRAGRIRGKDVRHGNEIRRYYMFCTADWNGIPMSRRSDTPLALGVDHQPIRLQEFYDRYEPRMTQSGEPFGPAAIEARSAVRTSRTSPEEWERWKDWTLEGLFAETPD